MSKSNIIGVKKIQSFLSSCKFNVNEPGPLKIIADTRNPDYYENRAIEFIQEAQQDPNNSVYEDKIRKAITLLTLAAIIRKDKHGTLQS